MAYGRHLVDQLVGTNRTVLTDELVDELRGVAIANNTETDNVAFASVGAVLADKEYLRIGEKTYFVAGGISGEIDGIGTDVNGVRTISTVSNGDFEAKSPVYYFPPKFETVADMSLYSGELHAGMQVTTRGFITKGIGYATYDVVLASSVTADARRVIASVGVPTLAFVLRIGSTTWLEQWGLVEGGDFYTIHKAATDYIRSISDSDQSKRVVIRCMSGEFIASDAIDFYPFQAPFIADKEARILNSHTNNYCSAVAFSAYSGATSSVPGRDRQPQAFIKNLTIVVKNNQRGMLIDSDRYNTSGTYTYPSYLGLELENVQLITDAQPSDGDFYRGFELGQSVYEVIFNHCESWYMTEHVLGKDVSGSALSPNTGVGIQFNDCHFTYANESVASQRGFTLISNQWKVNLNGCSLLHLHEHVWLQNGASISLLNSRIEGARLPEGANAGEVAPSSNGFVQITSGGKFSMIGGDMINYLTGGDIQFKAAYYVSGGTEAAQAQINMQSVDTYGMRGTEYADIGGVWVAFDGVGGVADINIRDNFRRHPVSTNDDPLLISLNTRGDEKEVAVNPLSIVCRNTTDGDGTGLISTITTPTGLGIPSAYTAIRLQKDGSNSSVLCIPFRLQDQSKQVSYGFYANASESIPYEVYYCNMIRDFSSFRSITRFDKYASELSGNITAESDFTPYYMCTSRPVGGYEYAVIEFDFSSASNGAYVDLYAFVVNNFR